MEGNLKDKIYQYGDEIYLVSLTIISILGIILLYLYLKENFFQATAVIFLFYVFNLYVKTHSNNILFPGVILSLILFVTPNWMFFDTLPRPF